MRGMRLVHFQRLFKFFVPLLPLSDYWTAPLKSGWNSLRFRIQNLRILRATLRARFRRSAPDKRASLSQLRATIPPRIPSIDANRKLFREKIWKRDPRRRWNRVRSDRLSVSLLKSALPLFPSFSLSSSLFQTKSNRNGFSPLGKSKGNGEGRIGDWFLGIGRVLEPIERSWIDLFPWTSNRSSMIRINFYFVDKSNDNSRSKQTSSG